MGPTSSFAQVREDSVPRVAPCRRRSRGRFPTCDGCIAHVLVRAAREWLTSAVSHFPRLGQVTEARHAALERCQPRLRNTWCNNLQGRVDTLALSVSNGDSISCAMASDRASFGCPVG